MQQILDSLKRSSLFLLFLFKCGSETETRMARIRPEFRKSGKRSSGLPSSSFPSTLVFILFNTFLNFVTEDGSNKLECLYLKSLLWQCCSTLFVTEDGSTKLESLSPKCFLWQCCSTLSYKFHHWRWGQISHSVCSLKVFCDSVNQHFLINFISEDEVT